MNKQQFINYIKSPQDLNAETVLTLENLVKGISLLPDCRIIIHA